MAYNVKRRSREIGIRHLRNEISSFERMLEGIRRVLSPAQA
jgi:hypothetical protein